MKSTCFSDTNTKELSFKTCGLPVCRQAGTSPLKTKLYSDEKAYVFFNYYSVKLYVL